MNINELANNLKKNWANWNVVQRSTALNRLKTAGYSGYELADLVGCSEANIRKILEVEYMSPYERMLLLLPGQSYRKVRAMHRERRKAEKLTAQQKAVESGYRNILFWLQRAQLGSCYEEQIFLEILAFDRGGDAEKYNITLEDCFKLTKPKDFDQATGIDRFNLEIDWLFAFLCGAIPEGEVRELALRKALSNAGRNLNPPIL